MTAPDDAVLRRVRDLWETVSGAAVAFPPPGSPAAVVTSPGSGLCPPGWVGIVALGRSAIVTAPDTTVARTLRQAFSTLPADALTCADTVRSVLPVAEVLSPATLAYVTEDAFRPVPYEGGVERLSAEHPDVKDLLGAVGPADAEESGLAEVTSPVFALRIRDETSEAPNRPDDTGRPGAGPPLLTAAGYRHWPRDTAHLCVLTAPERRGQGLARRVASAATAHALAAALLPQWRARPPASRRVARALGFQELGRQLSVRPDFPHPATGVTEGA
ncbi:MULTISPECIES: GNAT family N-acetyltransferase [Streptomyces]|uniref:GNAT family N-acetyltransferase n=1 Tax=Streptomyces TaxID=1883 RepID=UPI000518710F|nr:MULTISPECIES: GNAT family N-acetyltransferase [Streptomyces]